MIRVITVYTAVSLAILELVSNISEPFGLPGWTLKFIFVILIIGLIRTIIRHTYEGGTSFQTSSLIRYWGWRTITKHCHS